MSFIVSVQPRAEQDVDNIYRWLRKRSPLGAVRWYVALQQALRDLADRPERFAQAAEGRRIGRDVRQSFFKTCRGRRYRLLFTIIGTEIRVLRVRGPGQRPMRPRDLDP